VAQDDDSHAGAFVLRHEGASEGRFDAERLEQLPGDDLAAQVHRQAATGQRQVRIARRKKTPQQRRTPSDVRDILISDRAAGWSPS
jgi:hypothetical protein